MLLFSGVAWYIGADRKNGQHASLVSQQCLAFVGRGPKPFASFRDHFGGACRTALNHRNSGRSALRQSVILHALCCIRLAPKMLNVARKKALDDGHCILCTSYTFS